MKLKNKENRKAMITLNGKIIVPTNINGIYSSLSIGTKQAYLSCISISFPVFFLYILYVYNISSIYNICNSKIRMKGEI